MCMCYKVNLNDTVSYLLFGILLSSKMCAFAKKETLFFDIVHHKYMTTHSKNRTILHLSSWHRLCLKNFPSHHLENNHVLSSEIRLPHIVDTVLYFLRCSSYCFRRCVLRSHCYVRLYPCALCVWIVLCCVHWLVALFLSCFQ